MNISASLFISYSVIHTELYDTQEKLELIIFSVIYKHLYKIPLPFLSLQAIFWMDGFLSQISISLFVKLGLLERHEWDLE